MDLSQLADAAYLLNFIDMKQIAQTLEIVYFCIVIIFIMMQSSEEDTKEERTKSTNKGLCSFFAILSVLLFLIEEENLAKYFYLLPISAIAAYVIIKKYFPKIFKAQN